MASQQPLVIVDPTSHTTTTLPLSLPRRYPSRDAPRAWFESFSTVFTSLGFHPSDHKSVLFVRSNSHGRITLFLYVDDMIIISGDVNGINKLKLLLSKQFEMKDLGTLHYFVGIEVSYSPRGYLLSQSKYIASILGKDLLSNTRVVNSPFEINVNYASFDGAILPDPTLYRTLVGILVHLTIIILDIAYEVRVVELRVYYDVDWAGDPTDYKSTTWFYIFLGYCLISWKSKSKALSFALLQKHSIMH
ncbi:uncharacterized mitochondrial protein AtMg00810 [Lathyrus oleraceus]|uniref:uncharacterized mitochondrial protein AtMg00810 n=1 Tax=Pisum sativum TaxID=3888 RepID=UPI0021D0C53B|nr:uncharacterized mitochondrial protein AtMg00810-like [Pisum sativum]